MKALLPITDLGLFRSWLIAQGWVEEAKSNNEALRMRLKLLNQKPVILYTRSGSQLLSYNCKETGTLVVRFKKEHGRG